MERWGRLSQSMKKAAKSGKGRGRKQGQRKKKKRKEKEEKWVNNDDQ